MQGLIKLTVLCASLAYAGTALAHDRGGENRRHGERGVQSRSHDERSEHEALKGERRPHGETGTHRSRHDDHRDGEGRRDEDDRQGGKRS